MTRPHTPSGAMDAPADLETIARRAGQRLGRVLGRYTSYAADAMTALYDGTEEEAERAWTYACTAARELDADRVAYADRLRDAGMPPRLTIRPENVHERARFVVDHVTPSIGVPLRVAVILLETITGASPRDLHDLLEGLGADGVVTLPARQRQVGGRIPMLSVRRTTMPRKD